jgi:hypothetical protein
MSDKLNNAPTTGDLSHLLPAIVAAARTGDYAQGAALLNRFLRILQQELSKGYIAADGLSKVTYSLETLLSMQQMENWVAFADILEYEFLPLWRELSADLSGSG